MQHFESHVARISCKDEDRAVIGKIDVHAAAVVFVELTTGRLSPAEYAAVSIDWDIRPNSQSTRELVAGPMHKMQWKRPTAKGFWTGPSLW